MTSPSSDEETASGPVPLAVEGPQAPPRANGELVFDAPWQSRAFGAAAALSESGVLSWDEFQAALISTVATADADRRDTGSPTVYWECWLDALGNLLDQQATLDRDRWSERSRLLAERPAGHDH